MSDVEKIIVEALQQDTLLCHMNGSAVPWQGLAANALFALRAAGYVIVKPEWEYTWVGRDWILDDRFDTIQEAVEFGGSATGLWVQRQGGRVCRRNAGAWQPAQIIVEWEEEDE